jgi:hypothetical protein
MRLRYISKFFDRLAAIKFPTPITAGSPSYLAAMRRWADWWMRIFQRNILYVVTKSIAPRIRIYNALARTPLPMDYSAEVADTVPLIRHPQHSESEFETEPKSSEDDQSSSDHSSSAHTLIVSPSDDGTEAQSSMQSSSEHSSNAPTLIVSPSDDDTEVQSSMQQSDDRTPGTNALVDDDDAHAQPLDAPTLSVTSSDEADGGKEKRDQSIASRSTSKTFTPLLGKSHRDCFIYDEASDEEVVCGSFKIVANQNIQSDHGWSASENDSLDKATRVN